MNNAMLELEYAETASKIYMLDYNDETVRGYLEQKLEGYELDIDRIMEVGKNIYEASKEKKEMESIRETNRPLKRKIYTGNSIEDVMNVFQFDTRLFPVYSEDLKNAFWDAEIQMVIIAPDFIRDSLGNLKLETTDSKGNKRFETLKPFQVWHCQTPKVVWKPIDKILCNEGKRSYFNTYRSPAKNLARLGRTSDKAIAYFENILKFHVYELLGKGIAEQGKWIEQTVAHMLQKPWQRGTVATIMRSGKGSGKGLFLEKLMKGILGKMLQEVSPSEKGSQVEDNIEYHKSLMVYYHEGAIKKESLGDLKDKITNNELQIKMKNRDTFSCKVFSRVFADGNDEISIRMKGEDRRFTMLECSTFNMKDRDTKQYKRMMTILSNLCSNAKYQRIAYDYFMNLDISEYDPFSPIITKESRYQMELNISHAASWFRDYAKSIMKEYNFEKAFHELSNDKIAIDPDIAFKAYKESLNDKAKAFAKEKLFKADILRDLPVDYKKFRIDDSQVSRGYVFDKKEIFKDFEDESSSNSESSSSSNFESSSNSGIGTDFERCVCKWSNEVFGIKSTPIYPPISNTEIGTGTKLELKLELKNGPQTPILSQSTVTSSLQFHSSNKKDSILKDKNSHFLDKTSKKSGTLELKSGTDYSSIKNGDISPSAKGKVFPSMTGLEGGMEGGMLACLPKEELEAAMKAKAAKKAKTSGYYFD